MLCHVNQLSRSEIGSENCDYACQSSATNSNKNLENKRTSNQKVALITQRSRVQIPPPQPNTKS